MYSKMKRFAMGLTGLAFVGGLLAFGVSCSEEDGNVVLVPDQVTITGSHATSVVFTVAGGVEPYEWNIASTANGSLVVNGNQAIYTSVAGNGANFITVVDYYGDWDQAQVLQNP
ncbi:MAG: hypothetical protein WCL16_04560 [bacterium]